MGWNKTQQLALALAPKFSSLLSTFGSTWIVVEVLTENEDSRNRKRDHPYHRLLFAMSVYDILESVANFTSTWPLPRGSPDVWNPLGNQYTCSAQGYFLTLSVAVPIYNALLSLYYVLVIKYGIRDAILRKWIEPAMHLTAFAWSFFTATYSASTGLINNASLWCWIAPYPAGCKERWKYGDEGDCERGDNAFLYRWGFYFAPLWFCIFFATVCTIIVFGKVRKHDVSMLRYRPERSMQSFVMEAHSRSDAPNRQTNANTEHVSQELDQESDDSGNANPVAASGESNHVDSQLDLASDDDSGNTNAADTSNEDVRRIQRNMSLSRVTFALSRSTKSIGKLRSEVVDRRKDFAQNHPRTYEVFKQSLWYLGVFYVTHLWSTTNRILQQTRSGDTVFGVILLHSWFDPLQGFLNFLVYQRPRYNKIRRQRTQLSTYQCLRRALRWTYLPTLPVNVIPHESSRSETGEANIVSSAG